MLQQENTNKIILEISAKIKPVLKKYNVSKAAIFGSYARGNFTKRSDIDILVKLPKNIDLFEFIKMKNEMEDILHKKIDLVEYSTLKPIIKDVIIKEQIIIYE